MPSNNLFNAKSSIAVPAILLVLSVFVTAFIYFFPNALNSSLERIDPDSNPSYSEQFAYAALFDAPITLRFLHSVDLERNGQFLVELLEMDTDELNRVDSHEGYLYFVGDSTYRDGAIWREILYRQNVNTGELETLLTWQTMEELDPTYGTYVEEVSPHVIVLDNNIYVVYGDGKSNSAVFSSRINPIDFSYIGKDSVVPFGKYHDSVKTWNELFEYTNMLNLPNDYKLVPVYKTPEYAEGYDH